MDSKLSKKTALDLLTAESAGDVRKIIETGDAAEWFKDPQHWAPYGNRAKNWDTVGNQQNNPIGSLVEIITNGIDAILLRRAREEGIQDPRGRDAPQSMSDAVKRFFPHVTEGKIGLLEPKDRTELAKQCVQMAIKRPIRKNHQYPTYTIIDFGEGQLPEDFPTTFVSLSEKNKEGIPFVQGKFNMGSTGSLRFCTRSEMKLGHYKLIVSRKVGQEYWGWTLIRVRYARDGESLPVAEYFYPYGKAIPKFAASDIKAFNREDLGVIEQGTIIKLYEYDIGPDARQVDMGLRNALTVSLIDCALPIYLADFNATPVQGKGPLRAEGIATSTFSGLNVVLQADAAEMVQSDNDAEQHISKKPRTKWVHQIADIKDEELGRFKIVATAVENLQDHLRKQPARVFYTINGQTHAFERSSFLNQQVQLPDLRNHVLINVICDQMDKNALATIFMPDRERKTNTELSRLLEKTVIDQLKSSSKLREYANEIAVRRAAENIEDDEATKELLGEMIKSDPAIKELFGLGAFLPDISTTPKGIEPFVGKKFPTFLEPLNLRKENNVYVKEIPLNGFRKIECGTDAEDDYLTRIDSPGDAWCSLNATTMPHAVNLRNGVARFTIHAPKTAKEGDETAVEFGFVDYGQNIAPLKFHVKIRYIAEQEKAVNPTGNKRKVKSVEKEIVGEPKIQWVTTDSWSDHDFDEFSGAYVAHGEQLTIYVNQDNKHLCAMRSREKSESQRLIKQNTFRLGLGLLTLAIFRKFTSRDQSSSSNSVDAEAVTRDASAAMAPYIISVIQKVGQGIDAVDM